VRREADRIFIEGMAFFGRCGVTAEQRRKRRKVLVDMEVVTSCRKAGMSDELEDTVDYGELYNVAKKIIEQKTVCLLESWAEMIAGEVLRRLKVKEVRVRIRKPGVIAKGVVPGVEIVRTKA
jgi:dihydroneopterin aldolase